ncbi:MAG: hypothetical protein ACLGHN_00305 [Bacteriovoracia bacterium]
MKTDLTTTGSFAQSKALRQEARKNLIPKPLMGKLPLEKTPDYKVDLSSASKTQGSLPSPGIPSPPAPSLPDLPKPDLDSSPAKDLAKDAIKEETKEKIQEVKKVEVPDRTMKKPAVLFIKGLDLFSSPLKSEGGYAGVGRIAESVEGSRIYGWDQKTEILDEIRKVHPDYPVILVGHSLGGDTAIEIADELDSLEQGFRSIDLLVTIDAVGLSHDIIPQNVKRHLNIFGETSLFLNDGPHVARREEKTAVRNILSPLDHTDIDDDREVQFEIVDLIQKTLKSKG